MSVLHFQIKSSSSGEKKQLRQNLRYMFVKREKPWKENLVTERFLGFAKFSANIYLFKVNNRKALKKGMKYVQI